MVRLIPLNCKKCGGQLYSKKKDIILVCENCGNVMEFDDSDGMVKNIAYKIIKYSAEYQGQKVYVPFWTVYADINILYEKNVGGGFKRLFSKDDGSMVGRWRIFVCAADWPPEVAKKWNQSLTYSPPEMVEESDFGEIPRVNAIVTHDDAAREAEFLFLAHELEKAGILQEINYTFNVVGYELLYIPFYLYNNQYYLGLSGGRGQ